MDKTVRVSLLFVGTCKILVTLKAKSIAVSTVCRHRYTVYHTHLLRYIFMLYYFWEFELHSSAVKA